MYPRELLDPELAAILDALPIPTMDAETVAMIRGLAFPTTRSDAVLRTIEAVPGSPELRVHVSRPVTTTGSAPCVLSMHGGGYVIGSPEMDDTTFDAWCPALGVIGVSVDYRLAPETPYPGPLDDCYRALLWTVDNAPRLGIDPDRIGVHGVSACA